MINLSKYILISVAAFLTLSLSSCRKELCYEHYRSADINLSWEQEWERDYGMAHVDNWDAELHGRQYNDLRPGLPEGVTMITYTNDANPRETYMSTDGKKIDVGQPGQYSFLFYNNDTEYIILSDVASLNDARASTTSRTRSSIQKLNSMYPSVRSTNPPDVLYAAFTNDVPEVGIHQVVPLPIKMQPLVYTYVIRYEFEYGIHHVALARGALAGMAESVYLRTGATSEESSILLYDCDIKSYGCEAVVRSFGIPGFPDSFYGRSPLARADQPYTVNLEVKLTYGETVEFNFDIADQIAKQPRGGVIRISGIRIDDDLNMPPTDAPFEATVSDWGAHEDIDLTISAR